MSSERNAVGKSEAFDLVILAIGYGLERDGATSYWRNEILGQPALDRPKQTFLVSGQGDGAFIDLLRLRISQYRQDRILDELFSRKGDLRAALKVLHDKFTSGHGSVNMFGEFERLADGENPAGKQFTASCAELRQRLRRDTEVVLRTRKQPFERLFDPSYARSSFQNKLLVYMLYKCGAFIPSSKKERLIRSEWSVSKRYVVRRHGTQRKKNLKRILSQLIFAEFVKQNESSALSLDDHQRWAGGYFGFPGPSAKAKDLPDDQKKVWRKEYLPGSTALVASAFCASLAGEAARLHPKDKRLRITLHRALPFGDEEVLQQACEYQGLMLDPEPSAGRTFPARNATIGLAYSCRQIVRSNRSVTRDELRSAMELLNLNEASSAMAADVSFLMAIPLLEPELKYTAPAPVCGVIYIDSKAHDYYIDDEQLTTLVSIAQSFLDGVVGRNDPLGGIRNVHLSSTSNARLLPGKPPKGVSKALELVTKVPPPRSSESFQFNFDYSDFVPTA
jgi:hypothetical protein